MKKNILFLLLIILSISLIACDPVIYCFKYNPRNDEIVSIELISYTPDEYAVTESTEDMLDFDSDKMEILEVLDTTENENFISDFSKIEFFQEGFPHLNTPKGIGVKINYENGDFVVVTISFLDDDSDGGDAILYNSEGVFLEYYGGIPWIPSFVNLINKYFEAQTD